MTGWLTVLVAAAVLEPPPETFVLTFEPETDILTVEGYRAAHDASEAFRALPQVFPYQTYVWITDCREEAPYDLELTAEAEMMALGITPYRLYRSPSHPELDPCLSDQPSEQSVLVGVGRFEGGPWLSHDDMRGVYFTPGSSIIGDEWMPTLRRARTYIANDSYLDITGHTDTAEADPGQLSQARAQAYRDAMVRLGVPDWQMRSQGMGADQLARATPEDTAEPLNRRVSIHIRQVNHERRTPAWWFEQRDAWLVSHRERDSRPTPPSAD